MLYEFLRQKLKMYNVKVSKSAKKKLAKKSFKNLFLRENPPKNWWFFNQNRVFQRGNWPFEKLIVDVSLFCFKNPRRVNFYTNNRRQVIVYKCSKAAIFQNNNDAAEKTKLASCIFVEKLAIISSFRNAKIARIEKEMPVAIRPFQRLKA